MKAIKDLNLEVTVDSIIHSIVKAPRLKIKEQHISTEGDSIINISPYEKSRDRMYFVLQTLKSKLPQIQIKGFDKVQRAVVMHKKKDEDPGDSGLKMGIEGYGLK